MEEVADNVLLGILTRVEIYNFAREIFDVDVL